jgi:hypothetical protein
MARAHEALEAVGDDPDVLANAAFALSFLGENIGTQIALIDKALALNPSFARGWAISGPLRLWAGQPELAINKPRRGSGPTAGSPPVMVIWVGSTMRAK